MARAGRKPLGPNLVEHLEGSQQAKQRLEVILETITGRLTIDQACQSLAIKPAMFHRLRTEVLEAGLARLEPRPVGRPPHQLSVEETRMAALHDQVAELESELKLAAVREEIARVMPQLAREDSPGKKTTQALRRRRRRLAKQRRRRPPPNQ
jgi:uncharacterized small protein (DUF1192 family)